MKIDRINEITTSSYGFTVHNHSSLDWGTAIERWSVGNVFCSREPQFYQLRMLTPEELGFSDAKIAALFNTFFQKVLNDDYFQYIRSESLPKGISVKIVNESEVHILLHAMSKNVQMFNSTPCIWVSTSS